MKKLSSCFDGDLKSKISTNDLVLAKASSVLKQKKNVYFCFVIHSFILARIVFVLTIPTAHRKSFAQIIFVNKIAQKNNWISRLNIHISTILILYNHDYNMKKMDKVKKNYIIRFKKCSFES